MSIRKRTWKKPMAGDHALDRRSDGRQRTSRAPTVRQPQGSRSLPYRDRRPDAVRHLSRRRLKIHGEGRRQEFLAIAGAGISAGTHDAAKSAGMEGHIGNYICRDPKRHEGKLRPSRLKEFDGGIGGIKLSQLTRAQSGIFAIGCATPASRSSPPAKSSAPCNSFSPCG